MILICGLGNPGKKYVNTRHNVGFILVNKLIEKYSFELLGKDKKKEIFKGVIGDFKCLILKPQTYMNFSGLAVKDILNYYKIDINNLYVIHDDLDLDIKKVKIKLGGGNAGHNGLSSIDEMIGKNYNRIRIGINHPGEKHLVSNHVLSKFNNEESALIENLLNKISLLFPILLLDKSLFLTQLNEKNN